MAKNVDIRLHLGWFDNLKIRKVRMRLGFEGVVALLLLWEYAAAHNPSGCLGKLSSEELSLLSRYSDFRKGSSSVFGDSLIEFGLLEKDPEGNIWVHDWYENQPYIATRLAMSEGGKRGADRRWAKKQPAPRAEDDGVQSDPNGDPIGDPNAPILSYPNLAQPNLPNPEEKTLPDSQSEPAEPGTKKPKRTAKKKATKKQPAKVPGYSEAIDAWDRAFREATGQKPTWSPKHFPHVKRLLKVHGLEAFVFRVESFWLHHLAGTWWAERPEFLQLVSNFDACAEPPAGHRKQVGGRDESLEFIEGVLEANRRGEGPLG
jgi:hypothetical protein